MRELRRLNDYQEKLLTNLELEQIELCLENIIPVFKNLLPAFSTIAELCICIRHGGNAMYNVLVDFLERSNSDNIRYLSPVNIVEQFSWVWYDVLRKEVVSSTWVLSPTKDLTQKMAEFYKPDNSHCVLLLESFCQCFYLKLEHGEEVDCKCVPEIRSSLNPFHIAVMKFYQ